MELRASIILSKCRCMSVHAGVCTYEGRPEVDGGAFTNHSPLDFSLKWGL